MKDKVYTLQELRIIANDCYRRRWRIGKDYFDGLDGFLDVIKLMEDKKVSTVEDALKDFESLEDERYPL